MHPELATSHTPGSIRMIPLAFVFLVAFLAVTRTQEPSKEGVVTEPPKQGEVTNKGDVTDPPKEEEVTEPPKEGEVPGLPKVCSCEGPSCNDETTVKCTEGQDICISVVDQFILKADKTSFDGQFKGCAKTNESVGGSFSFDFGLGMQLNINSKLCNTLGCNVSVNASLIRNFENEKVCPMCYKSGKSSCTANGTVLCRGDLLNCTTVQGVIIEGNSKILFAGQGCTTPSVCDIKKKNSPVRFPSGLFTLQFDKVTCNSPSSLGLSLLVAFFSPCLLGLLTVNTFSA